MRKNHCVFMKCFRAKRILFWTKHVRAGAETLPDDPENSQEDEIQVARVPGVSEVGSLPGVMRWRREHNVLVPVSRPAHWDFGLHR